MKWSILQKNTFVSKDVICRTEVTRFGGAEVLFERRDEVAV